jgi:TRAP-type mannitol/chloroaromatic compound transport system permease small subunit
MRPHPYLRAYMAGIVVPTLFLLVIVAVCAYQRYYFEVPSQFVLGYPALPLDRAFLFPMAIVPNAWGLWNMLYLALRSRARIPVGIFGSLLILILVPGGVVLTRLFDSYPIQMAAGRSHGGEVQPAGPGLPGRGTQAVLTSARRASRKTVARRPTRREETTRRGRSGSRSTRTLPLGPALPGG